MFGDGCRCDPRNGIVIGDTEGIQTKFDRILHHGLRRFPSVGAVGVNMQIDHCAFSQTGGKRTVGIEKVMNVREMIRSVNVVRLKEDGSN